MILLIIASLPPKSQATISNWNSPTLPQLSEPMITNAKQILSSIFFTPF
jgi:hypothetical protein